MKGDLLLVRTDGTTDYVHNEFHSYRDVWHGEPIDMVFHPNITVIVSDTGLVMGLPLNFPITFLLGQPIYGDAICAAGHTEHDDSTRPLDKTGEGVVQQLASIWRTVLSNAEFIGQKIEVYPTPDTMPPPMVVGLPDDWLPGDPIPWPRVPRDPDLNQRTQPERDTE